MRGLKLISLFCLMLLMTLVSAVAFENEQIDQGLTQFTWSFDNPWQAQKVSFKEHWQSYIDNINCDVTSIDIYFETEVTQRTRECQSQPRSCALTDHKNGTIENVCTETPDLCADVDVVTKELFDLEDSDFLLPADSRIVVKGTRSPKLGAQACDMNFLFDDGIQSYDAKDGGDLGLSSSPPRAWWNLSLTKKLNIDCSSVTDGTPIIVNGSTGFKIDGETQLVWTTCQGTGMAVYFNNYSDYVVANDTVAIDFEVESGNRSSVNPTGVWDENYMFVHHMTEDPSGTALDSTSNSNNCVDGGLMDSADLVSGFVGTGWNADFNSGEYMNCGDVDVIYGTIEIWAFPHDAQDGTDFENIFSKRDAFTMRHDDTSNSGRVFVVYQGGGSGGTGAISYSPNVWHSRIAEFDGTNLTTYLNGTNVYNVTTPAKTIANNAFHWAIMGEDSAAREYDGVTDEARLSNISRGDAYASQVYNNAAGTSGYGDVTTLEESQVPPVISTIGIQALNTSSGQVYGAGSVAFNTSLMQDIEKLRINFTVTDTDNVSTVKVWFVANGSNSCSLGNRQDEVCIEPLNYIEWQNNTVTEYFNASLGTVGDNINCTVSGVPSAQTWVCDMDEHYQNVWKNYELDFGDVKWQTTANFRVEDETWWKVQINQTIVPSDAHLYKLDFRVSSDNSSLPPLQPIELFLCNSTYTSGDPNTAIDCAVVSSKNAGDLQDDGTKFRAIIPQSFVSTLGDIGYALISSDETNPARYYSMKTYAILNGGSSNVEISSDDASTWSALADGYETDFNINWFYNGTSSNISGLQLIVEANDTVGNTTNSSLGGFLWNLGLLPNRAPELIVETPSVDQAHNLTVPINFTVLDVNNDRFITNVTVNNATNSTIIGLQLPDTNTSFNFDASGWGSGTYNLTIIACENATSSLFCDTHTRAISFGNSAPTGAWTDTSPLTISTSPRTLNFTCTDAQTSPVNASVFVNGTLNATGQISGVVFSSVTGATLNYSLTCFDGVFNSTQTDLSLTFNPTCSVSLSGLEAGYRYRTLSVSGISATCSNSLNISNCSIQTNEFAPETISDCSDFNYTLEPGWNRLNLIVNSGAVSASNQSLNVFGSIESGTFWDYPLLLYMSAICLLLFLGSWYFNSEIGFGIFIVAGLRLGFEFLSLSIIAAVIVSGLVVLVGLAGILSKRSSGWMGNGQEF